MMNKETSLERIKRDIKSSDRFGYRVDDDTRWLIEEIERLTKPKNRVQAENGQWVELDDPIITGEIESRIIKDNIDLQNEVERQSAIINEAYHFLKQGYDTCAKGLLSPETKGGK